VLVADKVIIEIKYIPDLAKCTVSRRSTYLKLMGLKMALLVNFIRRTLSRAFSGR
jgi:GxxExxY protein